MPNQSADGAAAVALETEKRPEHSNKTAVVLAVVATLSGWGTAAITNVDKFVGRKEQREAAPPAIASAPSPAMQRLFVVGRIEDAEGNSMPGVSISVIELRLDNSSRNVSVHKTDEAGGFNFPVTIPEDSQIRIQTEQPGYRSQMVILQRGGVTIPATLPKIADRK